MSKELIEKLEHEADLCANEGATDIASLLREAIRELSSDRTIAWRDLEPFLGKDLPNTEVVKLGDLKAILAQPAQGEAATHLCGLLSNASQTNMDNLAHLYKSPPATVPQAEHEALKAAYRKAMGAACGMVNPHNPHGQPGSYMRGEYNGIVAVINHFREAFAAALSTNPADEVNP